MEVKGKEVVAGNSQTNPVPVIVLKKKMMMMMMMRKKQNLMKSVKKKVKRELELDHEEVKKGKKGKKKEDTEDREGKEQDLESHQRNIDMHLLMILNLWYGDI